MKTQVLVLRITASDKAELKSFLRICLVHNKKKEALIFQIDHFILFFRMILKLVLR